MDFKAIAKKLASRAARKKLIKTIPFLGAVFSVFFIVSKIREKGPKRGAADAALDMTPVVGRAKAVYEIFNDDIIPAK